MNKPELWQFDDLFEKELGSTQVWVIEKCREKVASILPFDRIGADELPSTGVDTLIVIGGGVLIDKAKVWRKDNSPNTRLVAMPSIWGSGAENSPIAVLNVDGKKVIFKGTDYLPDVRTYNTILAESLNDNIVQDACGDTWAHSIEGFLSPLASAELRSELADLINKMLNTPIANVTEWFELSARSCECQSRSSVGLIHAIAHVLEGEIVNAPYNKKIGHAKLCSVFFWPVLNYNLSVDKVRTYFNDYGIDVIKVIDVAKKLHDPNVFDYCLPFLEANWKRILKDICCRTNSTIVRMDSINFFKERKFSQ